MLTEKYRPKNLNEIILSDNIKNLIQSYLKKKEIPNLLFYSPSAGTGKTTLANLIVKEMQSEYIEINASNTRGIDIVRESIIPFLQVVSWNKNPKAILLSECEQLTSSCQKALKDCMERDFTKNNYFILTTNDRTKIISPIRSRCIELNFSYPPKNKIKERLLYICKQEKISLDEKTITQIINTLYPDIRKMINSLEAIRSGVSVDVAIETDFYKLYSSLYTMNLEELYEKIEELPVVSFLHYLFKVFLRQENVKGLEFVKITLRDIFLGVPEKIAFISNFLKYKKGGKNV